jgi:hypothetical protein
MDGHASVRHLTIGRTVCSPWQGSPRRSRHRNRSERHSPVPWGETVELFRNEVSWSWDVRWRASLASPADRSRQWTRSLLEDGSSWMDGDAWAAVGECRWRGTSSKRRCQVADRKGLLEWKAGRLSLGSWETISGWVFGAGCPGRRGGTVGMLDTRAALSRTLAGSMGVDSSSGVK